ncbi:MAG TPA: prepilin-type N-terminal cleavage/methylation domain-containing protein [Planctomycetota bacterium]|nr:prepilin-type N-terminal cleavage/methylation domain-containing protein [Planctomycetota bacterium]
MSLPAMNNHLRIKAFRARRPDSGFTFFELVVVVAIIGTLFAIGIPSLRGLTPKYRLRTGARELGTTLEQLRLAAMTRGLWMGVRYVITPGARDGSEASHYRAIPPAPEDFPDQPVEDRELLEKHGLPTGVRIAKVILAGNQVIDSGSINVLFSPMGNAGSHVVVFEGSEGRILSLKMNCITGAIDFIDGHEAGFQHFAE